MRNFYIKSKNLTVLAIVVTLVLVFSFCFSLIQKQSLIINKNEETLKPSTQNDFLDELFKVSRNVQWINNSDFENDKGFKYGNYEKG